MHHETLTRLAMTMKMLTHAEIAKTAGFASAKDLGENSAAMLNRFVEAGKLKAMEIGHRIFYHADTAKALLSDRRSLIPEGYVLATEHSVTRGYTRGTGPQACRSGKIKSAKFIAAGKTRAAWYCDKDELDAYFDRDRGVLYGAAAKRSKIPPTPAPEKTEKPAKPGLDGTIIRLEKVAAALLGVTERLERVLGSTSPAPPTQPKQSVLDIKIPALTSHVR